MLPAPPVFLRHACRYRVIWTPRAQTGSGRAVVATFRALGGGW